MLLQHRYLCKFPASSRLCFHRPLKNSLHRVALVVLRGARSCFRWKLHPSSQAWPLLSTSNRGETAIAKCGNSFNSSLSIPIPIPIPFIQFLFNSNSWDWNWYQFQFQFRNWPQPWTWMFNPQSTFYQNQGFHKKQLPGLASLLALKPGSWHLSEPHFTMECRGGEGGIAV